MMAEGHRDSQKASSKETRTWRKSTEVQSDRHERCQKGEGFGDEGAQTSDERNGNSGAGSLMEPGVGSDMNQVAGQRTEVGCHWSGSESGAEADEGHQEAEDGKGWETFGVQSDIEETGSRREGRQVEEVGETAKVGSGGGSEEKRKREGQHEQGRVWKDWWQRTRKKKMGERVGEAEQDIEEREVKGARMWGGDEFEDGEAVENGKIRAWFGNIRRFKMDDKNVAHISEIENRMWKQTNAYQGSGLRRGVGNAGKVCASFERNRLFSPSP